MASYEEFLKAAESKTEFEKFKAAATPHPVRDFASGVVTGANRAIAGAVDIAMSPVAVAREQITGRRVGGLQSMFPRAQTTAGQIGEAAGGAGAMALGGGGAASAVPAAGAAMSGRNAVQNFLNSVGVSFRTAPGRFMAAETLSGGTSAAGGATAQTLFPDSDAAKFVGEILGGFTPAGVRAAPGAAVTAAEQLPMTGAAIRGGRNIGNQLANMSNPLNVRQRADSRLDRATQSREVAAQRMDDPLLPGLTPAARTGDRGLLALETAVDKSLMDADKFVDASVNTTLQNIRAAIMEFAGNPEATARTFEAAQESLRKSLDDRLNIAARRTQETLASISPSASREAVNRVAAGELRAALQAARNEERRLYDLVPEDAVVPTNSTVRNFRDLLADLSQAQRDDMPSAAKEFLDVQSPTYFGAQTNIKEMRGLQSRLRQISRNSRSGDNTNLNRARIADQLADAITEDIANTQGGDAVSGAVRAAVGYSRELNDKFRKGTVGTLLGLAKQAEPRVAEGLALENSIGVTGPRAREAFDDIVKATNSPEVNAAMEDFIKNKFFDQAVINGQMDRARAAAFIRTNKEVLGRLPKVQADLDRVLEASDIRELRMAQRGRVSFDKPSVSRATMFIQRGPEAAFRSVLASRYPAREMTNLVNMARRDSTGEAEQGLKSAFSEYITAKGYRGRELSGEALQDFLSDPKTQSAMRGLFTGPEIRRWQTIADTASRLDLQKASQASAEGVLGDQPGQTATMLARLLGAAYGRHVGQQMGAGGTVQIPAIFSERFSALLKKGIDPSRQLLVDAVQDEKLFRELLMARVTPKGEIPEQAKRRLNAWLATLPQDEEEQ